MSLLTRNFTLLTVLVISGAPAYSQFPPLSPPQLDQLAARIALYPDPLLAQVLTASTFWNEIPDAAAWADQHSYLKGDALAEAIKQDNLQWDPSVLALLPFPSVLDTMAHDMVWTEQLGNAVLTQRADVMDAVQRMRHKAESYGYLQSNGYINVHNDGDYVEILPVNPGLYYVPVYDPLVVFAPPPPGFFIGGAIHFGPAITIGAAFAPWGWVHPGFGWRSHDVIIDRAPWGRVWANRATYIPHYDHPWVRAAGPRVERHAFRR